MGEIRPAQSVKLICGILFRDPQIREQVDFHLQDHFGPADYRSEVFPFEETDYYDKEMGTGIQRQYFAFRDLVLPDVLADAKRFTNHLESEFASPDGNRRVNLDPGLLSSANIILASTKNFYHRVYLRDGIYAEVTMFYRHGRFETLPWTYPDYRNHQQVFLEIRNLYRRQTRGESETPPE
ncbi:MAG TPA: DUF4416 family protein [bacterium]|nr:DUF4416 family protein [bacterium]